MDDTQRLIVNAEFALKYMDTIKQYMGYCNNDREEFLENTMVQDACITQIKNITQCVNKIRDRYPDVYNTYFSERHQKGLKGMRNILIHEYESRNEKEIWRFYVTDMPELETIFSKMISENTA